MNKTSTYPNLIGPGSHIRVIAPSRSLGIISQSVRDIANERLAARGFTLSFGKHVEEMDAFSSSSVESRVADLHAAFSDNSVDAVLTSIGGHNSVQLLNHLDFSLIANNPKVLMGFSDITTLSNAIFSQTGLVTFLGPHYSSWGMRDGFEFTEQAFSSSVEQPGGFVLSRSETWSDDAWFMDQDAREHVKNSDNQLIKAGSASGRVLGGNLSSLLLLAGTKYMPDLSGAVLFVEDDAEISIGQFDRMLQSLLMQNCANKIQALLIGRFQKETQMTNNLLQSIVLPKVQGLDIPIACNLNFGHTTPTGVLPIGAECRVDVNDTDVKIVFSKG